MHARYSGALFAVWLVASVGCGDDDATALPDAGFDAATIMFDATLPDAGPGPDAGSDAGLVYPVCDPRVADTCPDGEQCKELVDAFNSFTVSFRCRVDGSRAEGEMCTVAPIFTTTSVLLRDDCLGGLACRLPGTVPDTAVCGRICETGADCHAGEECLLNTVHTTAPLSRAGVCFTPLPCDARSGTGCPSDRVCRLLPTTDDHTFTGCFPPGPLERDESCGGAFCGTGLTCAPAPSADGTIDYASIDIRCREVCDPGATTTTCSDATRCNAAPPSASGMQFGLCQGNEPAPVGGTRPARVVVPPAFDGTTPLPLVLGLTGYGGSAAATDGSFRLSRTARALGFFAVIPDGTRSSAGAEFWNATPACCDYEGTGVDDSAYLLGLVTEMQARYPIDPRRIYAIGRSNGGYMAYRLACDHADVFAAIVSLSGSTFDMESDCHASEPVSVLEVHGTTDANVGYAGGMDAMGHRYPGAIDTVERWATRAGCDLAAYTESAPFDITTAIDGPETVARTYSAGCAAGHEMQLWTMTGVTHLYPTNDDFMAQAYTWMQAHPR